MCKKEQLYQLSDEELMLRFQNGTIKAFNALVDRYSIRLMRYLYRGCGDLMRCEDMIQETFERVYRNRHSYEKGKAQFANWIYTIASNLARSNYRKRRRRQTHCVQALNCDCRQGEEEIPDMSAPLEWHLEKDIVGRYIQKALAEIPAGFRRIVILRDIQQLSYDEISEIAGLPMGTVKSRINRGRSKLRTLLKNVNPYLSQRAEDLGLPWNWIDQIHTEATSEINRKEVKARQQHIFCSIEVDLTEAPVWIDHTGERHDLHELELEYRNYLRANFDYGKQQSEDTESGPVRTVEIDSKKTSLSDLVDEFEQHQNESKLEHIFGSLTS